MASVTALEVKPTCPAFLYAFPFESVTVKICELDIPPRTATAIQFPAELLAMKASDPLVVVPASRLAVCTNLGLMAGVNACSVVPIASSIVAPRIALPNVPYRLAVECEYLTHFIGLPRCL